MKKILLAIILTFGISIALAQDARQPSLEITGLDPTELPTVRVLVNAFDSVGQPVAGLTAADFEVVGELADRARVVEVTSFSDENIPISVVLAVDVSSSMAGMPIRAAQVAAGLFVNSIGPDDPVAIVTFSSGAQVVQDFTTDRDVLINAIEGLGFGGETYLFDGALEAVNKAAETDNRRRAVILLSDGAQYDTGGFSRATSEDVFDAAVVNGIPIYTIGLGFGADRHYLEGLSANTNALFRESPTPEELQTIYAELANLLRTQYEVVLEVDVPADGTTYDLELELTTEEGTATATGLLRAPVPVPVITLPTLDTPIESLTEVEATILADDGVESVAVSLDDEARLTLEEEPYIFIVDPVELAPGDHTLTFAATDTDGDVGTASVDFEVAALPSLVSIVPELSGEVSDVQSHSVEITGQTAPVSVELSMDGEVVSTLSEPYEFTVDPFTLAPGDHTLTLTVENAGGLTTTTESQFTVPELPIQFAISGLEPDMVLENSVDVSVDVSSSQTPVTDIAFELDGAPIEDENGTVTLNAFDLPPGSATLSVTVTSESGQTTADTNFEVAALPPSITIEGLESGEVLETDRVVSVEATSQTEVDSVTFRVDGQQIASEDSSAVLDVLGLGGGEHTLSVEVSNQGGASATAEVGFSIVEGIGLTATALVPPTATATEVDTATPTATVDTLPTVLARANELAATAGVRATGQANIIAQASATADAAINATQEQLDVISTVTSEAESTVVAEATAGQLSADATATGEAEVALTVTAETEITQEAATADAQATADLVATANALATTEAEESTVTAEAEEAEATTAALATENAAATQTQVAESTVTAEAEEAEATTAALATENAAATQTQAAESTVTAEAEEAEATTAALATENAAATQTQAAESTVTAEAEEAQATTSAEETAIALTEQAEETQVAVMALATENSVATATEAAILTITAEAEDAETATAEAEQDSTATAEAEATESAQLTATSDAESTATAEAQATADADATTDAAATSDAEATGTQNVIEAAADETATAEATEEVTEETDLTPTEEGTTVAQAVDEPTATVTEEEGDTPAPTITPIGTLIPAQAESTPSELPVIPIAIIVIVIVIVLFLIYLFLSRARRRRP